MGGASHSNSSHGTSHAGSSHGGSKTGSSTHGGAAHGKTGGSAAHGKTGGSATHGKTGSGAAHGKTGSSAAHGKAASGKAHGKTGTQAAQGKHGSKKTGHTTKDSFEGKPQNKTISDTVSRLNPKGHYLAANGQTHCNAFAGDYAKSMGDPSLSGKTANQQYAHMNNPANGYHKATAAEAMKAAADGKLAFAAYSNPNGHGHIAAVVGETGGRPAIAQAGKKNYNFTGVNYGFGKASPPSYFVHN